MFSNFTTYSDSIFLYVMCMLLSTFLAINAQLVPKIKNVLIDGQIKKLRYPNVILICLSCVVMLMLAYYRDHVGLDFQSYILIFDKASGKYVPDYLIADYSSIEKGFIWLNYIVARFGGNIYTLMGTSCAIMLGFMIPVWRDYGAKMSVALSILGFFTTYFYISLNITRQFISVGMLFYSTKYMWQRKPIHFFVLVFISSLFHGSSWFFALFYFAVGNKPFEKTFRKSLIIGLVGITFMLSTIGNLFMGIPVVNAYLSKYGDVNMSFTVLFKIGNVILKSPAYIPILIFRKQLVEYDKRNSMWLLFVLAEFISCFLGNISGLFLRPGIYLQISWIILLPQIVRIQKTRGKQYLAGIYVILFFAGSYIYNFVYMNYGIVLPYKTF